ncbi:Chymotrypsin-like elastase member 3B [Desmophyllum pertusum]|uniref:Chymotrypsin-like elastase member 3B n=1 Tax=Desmophyllum pertusum TaxID=174260 RepID=A0A9W9ZH24_9CNID|nr:Chymotrypsin-like elastase member 3B [Desmophyllum pertusum]
MMNIVTFTVVIIATLSTNQARHHIISRGHLTPPLKEPFFTADIELEPVQTELNVAVEKRVDELEANQDPHQSDSWETTGHKMPPPKGPLRDIKSPRSPGLDEDPHQSNSRGTTGHKMPPPKGPLRDIKSPRSPGLDEDPHQSNSRGTTGHKMPPPKGPLREIKPPFDQGSSSCGHSSSSSSRVINGADATLGEWPWQARLQLNHMHLCGGTLIMPEWLMTAAHCVLDNDPSKFEVILGDIDRNKIEGSEQKFKVKRIFKHRLFSHPVPYENDIALFQLSRPAKRGDLVNTACLPGFLDEVPVGTECYITGWGQMFGKGESATILQQARMPVVSNGACAAKLDTSPNGGLHTDNRTWIVTSKMICAGDAGNTKTSGCFGDSGGPFQCKNTAGQWVVQGIVSWGDPDCSSSNHYTVFTRVSVFRKWIEDVMENITST